MLFRKKIARSCTYCANATAMDEDQFLCIKKGVVVDTGKCRKFKYDATKRIPPEAVLPDIEAFSEADFSQEFKCPSCTSLVDIALKGRPLPWRILSYVHILCSRRYLLTPACLYAYHYCFHPTPSISFRKLSFM